MAALREFPDINVDIDDDDLINEYNDLFEAVKTMAIEGDVFAQMEMFHVFYTGKRTERNFDEAFEWCRLAAEAGNPDGMLFMGKCYEFGYTGDKDDEEACRWYLKAVKLNNTNAMLSLGRQYNYGRVVQQNHDVAFTLYMRAAELGDHDAMFKLGNLYDASEPDFGIEKNSGEAIRWYQQAYDFGKGDFAKHKVEKLLKKIL